LPLHLALRLAFFAAKLFDLTAAAYLLWYAVYVQILNFALVLESLTAKLLVTLLVLVLFSIAKI